MNSREIIKAIAADGWQLKRITGSHHHFVHATKLGIRAGTSRSGRFAASSARRE
jgi:glyoxylase-like metal-dependent hydrolase (beta-lactamase superfamily II)